MKNGYHCFSTYLGSKRKILAYGCEIYGAEINERLWTLSYPDINTYTAVRCKLLEGCDASFAEIQRELPVLLDL